MHENTLVCDMGNKHGCLSAACSSKHAKKSLTIATTENIQNASNNEEENRLNINHANEEELMLLPGIDRRIAQNIIEHRQATGNFKNVEDVALVNGINADVFAIISADICIENPPESDNLHLNSKSSTIMTPSIPQTGTTATHNNERVNINSATLDELRTIPGLEQKLAERIIRQREKKGPFQFVEDMLKIKGFNYMVLDSIRPHVTVDHQQVNESDDKCYECTNHNKNGTDTKHGSVITVPDGLSSSADDNNNLNSMLNRKKSNSDSLSIAALLYDMLPSEIHAMLLSYTNPLLERKLLLGICQINVESNVRFASWNLQQLNLDKVKNPGVREVICRTILEYNINLIGIQEIGHKDALDLIIDELNNPSLSLVKEWMGKPGKWKHTTSDSCGEMRQGNEYLGYIYDESYNITLKKASLFPLKDHFTHLPYIAVYKIHNIEIALVNVHLKATHLDEEGNVKTVDKALSLSAMAEAMKDTIEQKRVIIFGDFNQSPESEEFKPLITHGFSYLTNANTNISNQTPNGSTCVDNMWLSTEVKQFHTNNFGVIRDNLTSPWIPNGWDWGGLVSNHCPIWTDFEISEY
ncbi:unnamed protein product, partial [Didymodactylos carnosus]